jgi:hypothetical protein
VRLASVGVMMGVLFSCAFAAQAVRGAEGIVELSVKGDTLDIKVGGKPFTVYNFAKALPKPYFYPVYGPEGQVMTRPIVTPQRDHKHHRGLWFSIDEVNDIKFWAEGGKIENASVEPIVTKGNPARFKIVNNWLGKDNQPVLIESTTISIFANRLITYDAQLTAGKNPVTFGDTKEGLFGFRMVETMHEPLGRRGGAGKVVNAEGVQGSFKTWGKTSDWIDYYGSVEGKTLGVAIFDNPHNFRRSRYHVRNYGLFSISPFGEKSYTNGKNPEGIVNLKPGQSLRLRYGIYFHEGDTKAADVAGTYRKYVAEAGS